MKLTKPSDHIWQLEMREAEFQIIQKVTDRIALDFDRLDFWTLECVEKSQLTTLSAAFSGAICNGGYVVLEISDANYKVLRDVMDFADGFMNEEFEQDRDAINEEPRPDSRGLCCFMLRMSCFAAPCSHPHPSRWGIPAGLISLMF